MSGSQAKVILLANIRVPIPLRDADPRLKRSFDPLPCNLDAADVDRICSASSYAPTACEQGLVEGLHAEFARLLHDLLISDTSPLKIRSEINGELSMISMAATRPLAVFLRQSVRNQRAQVEREIHQQLLAALFREEVDDAVNRLVGAVGVQRCQTEVTSLGKATA